MWKWLLNQKCLVLFLGSTIKPSRLGRVFSSPAFLRNAKISWSGENSNSPSWKVKSSLSTEIVPSRSCTRSLLAIQALRWRFASRGTTRYRCSPVSWCTFHAKLRYNRLLVTNSELFLRLLPLVLPACLAPPSARAL